ncbi:hypothetical protein [Flavobacterium sp. KACC 22761]|uniref:hypothetical protein n=1 Tax=Flavobacterium sp. KACC 22761 TaxID=3092665 RepID=UPI002A754FF7|nr:hypothetical protein [Flavobacterium sp. KACC 22761]WPO77502.1 hypothetical protein SCB73_14630 [Flavobacterium sp. KACC 22761]
MRKVYLEGDQKKVTERPNEESDSISYFLKNWINRTLKGIDTDKLKYYTREKNDTLLVIVKVGDMLTIDRSSRKMLLYSVEDGLRMCEHTCNKAIYIDVEGNFNTLLVKSPLRYDLDGKFANEDLLLPFYGKSHISVKETTNKNF